MLHAKRILLGITGSIAAYKAALLVRLLVKAGAEVQVIMTEAAGEFITPLTLSTLSKRPVLSSFVGNPAEGTWNNHVELGLWADALVIAPASAHTLARCAFGLCNDLLSAVYLSAKCPVFFAPAMDLDMYRHPSTLHNIDRLASYGNHIIRAEHGELASGLVGEGRLAEPETIVEQLTHFFNQRGALVGRRVLITAGPTQEPIDPVRYISNHSTGKMGYAIARAFAMAGADVTLVSGPTALPLPHPAVRRVPVRSAAEMFRATEAEFEQADLLILNAAVADYTPAHPAHQKIKKKEAEFSLELTKTVDIAATLGARKRPGQLMMGFALETENEQENALGKLQRKNLDWIVLNSLRDAGAGFGHDTNKITVMDRGGNVRVFDLKTKEEVAEDLLTLVKEKLANP
ncbi:bifunctional phosphopantothenoylcysteine decarboxylase/phosphopantothenate--cysteine ligase CoaBC [Rudanella paleaurantiibacter]|uniref:Coenzyme A biosynthesis bifunctional protein CoaBC n=1 Tax=Rudanella paleaurantiibacter TaxID=2614655 RepID=A0A7J5TV49_9BACT|nr:bifunctional phosphopantothenoylcysteine decarboxylase/phosphopantothenate--cysteine ligase CoaBC [Rudanella paleaurantiibacter]KAB7727947.1 bifunctional phosphopantothenoylcysteine decarboxylase/phosphopantothenate--cysteine ligase CoaBC [Rudanella paleaurantiibacter]